SYLSPSLFSPCPAAPRLLHSFPTRRSSDLPCHFLEIHSRALFLTVSTVVDAQSIAFRMPSQALPAHSLAVLTTLPMMSDAKSSAFMMKSISTWNEPPPPSPPPNRPPSQDLKPSHFSRIQFFAVSSFSPSLSPHSSMPRLSKIDAPPAMSPDELEPSPLPEKRPVSQSQKPFHFSMIHSFALLNMSPSSLTCSMNQSPMPDAQSSSANVPSKLNVSRSQSMNPFHLSEIQFFAFSTCSAIGSAIRDQRTPMSCLKSPLNPRASSTSLPDTFCPVSFSRIH